MPPSSKPSGSVIAAAVVALIGSVLAVFGVSIGLLGTLIVPSTPNAQVLPAFVKTVAVIAMILFISLAVLGIFTGIGLLRLRNWARISAMIWAGVTVFFSAITLLFSMAMPLPPTPNLPTGAMASVRVFLLIFYGLPFLIGIWWLILFNRKSIAAQFAGMASSSDLSSSHAAPVPEKPRCPLPIAVIGGFLIFSSLSFVFVLTMHTPFVLFGHIVRGPAGKGIGILSCLLCLVAGLGLLRLKPWSNALTLGMQFFWLLSGTVTLLSSNYEALMKEVLSSSPFLVDQNYLVSYFARMRSYTEVGLLVPVIIGSILLYYRMRFLQACSAAVGTS